MRTVAGTLMAAVDVIAPGEIHSVDPRHHDVVVRFTDEESARRFAGVAAETVRAVRGGTLQRDDDWLAYCRMIRLVADRVLGRPIPDAVMIGWMMGLEGGLREAARHDDPFVVASGLLGLNEAEARSSHEEAYLAAREELWAEADRKPTAASKRRRA